MRSNSAACSKASEMCRYSAIFGSTVRSSSYPRSTTACRCARVIESPVANSVTSQPRETRPSVMLLATVSHAPYCRGGVRQATGERTATLLFRMHGGQNFGERNGSETRGVIRQTVRNDQFIPMHQRAAGVDDVRHISFALILVRLEQGLWQTANHFAGIVAIEQERADRVLPHRPDAVAEHQPAGICFNRRSAVAQLDQFPGKHGLEQHFVLIPKVHVV